MFNTPNGKKFFQALAVLCTSGVVLATSCGPKQIQAVVAGIQAANDSLEGRDRDQITFTDWLASELEN